MATYWWGNAVMDYSPIQEGWLSFNIHSLVPHASPIERRYSVQAL